MVGIRPKPFSGEDVLQDHEHSKLFFRFRTEERGNPTKRFRPFRMSCFEAVQNCDIVARTVVSLVERKIND